MKDATEYQQSLAEREVLLKALANVQGKINQGGQAIVDIHHPERSPNWPRYQHQSFPRMMYHPTQLDPLREKQRTGARKRNETHPNLDPLEIPASKPLIRIVKNEEEQAQAEAEGFVRTPPVPQMEDGGKKPARDPLADAAREEEERLAVATGSGEQRSKKKA